MVRRPYFFIELWQENDKGEKVNEKTTSNLLDDETYMNVPVGKYILNLRVQQENSDEPLTGHKLFAWKPAGSLPYNLHILQGSVQFKIVRENDDAIHAMGNNEEVGYGMILRRDFEVKEGPQKNMAIISNLQVKVVTAAKSRGTDYTLPNLSVKFYICGILPSL